VAPTATPPPASGSVTVVAVGDIYGEGSDGDSMATADAVDRINPAAILGLGDYQYSAGTCANFMTPGQYDSGWGRHTAKMYPTLGPTHDYAGSSSGSRADLYFSGLCAGQPAISAGALVAGGLLDWNEPYSFDLNGWHIVSLPSLCYRYGCDADAVTSWLSADLNGSSAHCQIAFWHEPYWTSPSSEHTRLSELRPWVDVLYEHGVDLQLNGHQHFYERFAPQTPDDAPDPDNGIRSFTVGTGGIGFYARDSTAANSVAYNADTYGVLSLTLGNGSYGWAFVRTGAGTYTDSGTGTCH
jgi:hypothetical protein